MQLVLLPSGTKDAWGSSWLQNKNNPNSQLSHSAINTTERLFHVVLKHSIHTCINKRGRTLGNARQFHLLLRQTERPSQAITRSPNTRYSWMPYLTRLPRSYPSIQWFRQPFSVGSP